jgi:L-alanine-DL-glutamate epimerase-like enolase superfamily enzyme
MGLIAHVEAHAIAPDVDRFRYTARSDEVFTTTTLLRITDEGGTTGIGGYDSDTFGGHDLAPIETLRTIVPRLIGLDADDREHVAAMLTEDGTSPFPPAVRSTRPSVVGPARRHCPPTPRCRCSTTRAPTSRRSPTSSTRGSGR